MDTIDIGKHPALRVESAQASGPAELEALKQDLAKLLHDLNNPLCLISMSLSRIELSPLLSKDEDLALCHQEVESALARIRSLLEDLHTKLG
jgi:signal transduction histidine kinase